MVAPRTAATPPGDNQSAAVMRFRAPRGTALLWFGILAGPVAWAIRLQVSYVLVPYACAAESQLSIHIVTAVTALLAASGAFVAWRAHRALGEGSTAASGAAGRSRFMALAGIVIGIWFIAQILVEGVPAFIVSACAGGET